MKKKIDINFMKEVIEDYQNLADEHEKLAKQYREISNFWKKRYDVERTRTSVLAPLFFDKVIVKTKRRTTFK